MLRRPLAHLLVTLASFACAGACVTSPGAGEFGTVRMIGRVKGDLPLRVLPPVADPSGNFYTANGAIDFLETTATVSRVGGGESSGCDLTRGDTYGLHGWVGFGASEAWYWSGDLLVKVNAEDGACTTVLEVSPNTNARLAFKAVLPWVYDAQSQTSVVAFVQAQTDLLPTLVRVDLRRQIFADTIDFSPGDASAVSVIGVGASREREAGYVLLQYTRAGNLVTEARAYDAFAAPLFARSVALDKQEPYSLSGYLQGSTEGLVAGALKSGDVLLFDERGATVKHPPFPAVGVHAWEGALYVVGVANGRPSIASIDAAGNIGAARVWAASERAAAVIGGLHDVRDDRTQPARTVSWPQPGNAIGPFPFVSPFPLTRHAPGVTLWAVSGPQYDGPAGKITSLAVGAVGVTYP